MSGLAVLAVRRAAPLLVVARLLMRRLLQRPLRRLLQLLLRLQALFHSRRPRPQWNQRNRADQQARTQPLPQRRHPRRPVTANQLPRPPLRVDQKRLHQQHRRPTKQHQHRTRQSPTRRNQGNKLSQVVGSRLIRCSRS